MQTPTDEIRVRAQDGRAPRPLLVVDDDELELCLLADRLGAKGFDVATACNAEQARQMLSTGAFPVVITDYQMPVTDGLQLVEQVRESQANASQPASSYFIMWSIRAEQVDREHGFSRGADDYVSKQSSEEELVARIEAGFNTIEVRKALLRGRAARRQAVMPDATHDVDAWNAAAARLHAEILRARRHRRPLTVLMLHVEHALAQPQQERLAPKQLECLLGALHGAIRHDVDWVAPLDASAGLARLLLVFPETSSHHAAAIRRRIAAALAEISITDEFAQMMPECSVGVSSIDVGDFDLRPESIAVNAATLVATAEQHVERLLQSEFDAVAVAR